MSESTKRSEPNAFQDDLAAYEAMRPELEGAYFGKWVLVHGRELVGVFDTFDAAAVEAVQRFGRGPYVIKQVGAAPVPIPVSVMYRPVITHDLVRLP